MSDNSINGGWIPANEAWVYSSTDGHTFVFTAPGDLTSKYSLGMRVTGINNSIQFYGFITKLSHSSGTTTITCYGGTDYTLANSTITLPYYSSAKAPQSFPLDPAKWSEELIDTSQHIQSSPADNTWYNINSNSLDIPIGVWITSYRASIRGVRTSAGPIQIFSTLSTANNSSTNPAFDCYTISATLSENTMSVYTQNPLALTSKTTYYLNEMIDTSNSGGQSLVLCSDFNRTIVRAVCAYL